MYILGLGGLVGVGLIEEPGEGGADVVDVALVIDNAVDGGRLEFDGLDVGDEYKLVVGVPAEFA